jgi:hypothetical protein
MSDGDAKAALDRFDDHAGFCGRDRCCVDDHAADLRLITNTLSEQEARIKDLEHVLMQDGVPMKFLSTDKELRVKLERTREGLRKTQAALVSRSGQAGENYALAMRYREALEEIVDPDLDETYSTSVHYRIGWQDGVRACARIARNALQPKAAT